MTFGESVRSCLSKYTTFSGRAPRSEFWWFSLFVPLMEIAAMIVDHLLGTTFKFANPASGAHQNFPYGWCYTLVAFGLYLPGISVMVRRLHDKARSGWWFWIAFVPIIGAILLLVWFCQRGTEGDNRFGPDPLADGTTEATA